MWHEALEEASRMYFGEHNIEGMLAVLEPLHAMLERGPETIKENTFIQVATSSKLSALCLKYFTVTPIQFFLEFGLFFTLLSVCLKK